MKLVELSENNTEGNILNRTKEVYEVKEVVDIDFNYIKNKLPTTDSTSDKHKRELLYAELDTTLEGVLDVNEIIEGIFKVCNIEKTNVNIKCIKINVIFAIFKTLDTIDEF